MSVPQELQRLKKLNQILVHQEFKQAFNQIIRYTVINKTGEKLYVGTYPNTIHCSEFNMGLFDDDKKEVIHLHRPLHKYKWVCCCCMNICLKETNVSSPPGTNLGKIEQNSSKMCSEEYVVKNAHGDTVLTIQGPTGCSSNLDFKIMSVNGNTEVGIIGPQWPNSNETVTSSSYFGVTFPEIMDVRTKALLLGATFMIAFKHMKKTQDEIDYDVPDFTELL